MSTEGGSPHRTRLGPLLAGLETATNRVEGPIRRFVGSNRLNPLPHAGTISVFLLIVVTVTGLYITLFFEFGFEDSYTSVLAMEGHPIQRAMRALHRISSAMLVVTTLVHAWRTFVAKRFTSSRRFRWLTGVLALALVWIAGVTGYWLVWDVRAQAIGESLAGLVEPMWGAVAVAFARPGESGWVTLFTIWVAHLAVTGIIGWALWRHLRRARFDWLPPYRWMWVMGLSLIVAAVLFPSGMLAAADPGQDPATMILDPYVMFLLPILASNWAPVFAVGSVAVIGVLAGLPWALRREDPHVAVISETACTGCELCVQDCPYLALSMTSDGTLAVVDPEKCVGCGICLGSCAFGAISGLGEVAIEGTGDVYVVCSRELRLSRIPPDVTVREVECTGAISPLSIGATALGGGTVHVIGCAPGECSYRTGNVLASARIAGDRRPSVPRRWREDVTRDWAAPDDIADLLAHPGRHSEAETASIPTGRPATARMAAVVLVSVLLIGATSASIGFDPGVDDATVRVVVDHRDGGVLQGFGDPVTGAPSVHVERNGTELSTIELGVSNRHATVIDVDIPPGESDLTVRFSAATTLELFDGTVDLAPGERLVIPAIDTAPSPGAELGREIFLGSGMSAQAGCQICHSLEPDRVLVGPSLAGVADVAATRVDGQSAAEYLRSSILEPDAYVVEGFRAGQMLPIYSEQLTAEEVDALVEYLLGLEGP